MKPVIELDSPCLTVLQTNHVLLVDLYKIIFPEVAPDRMNARRPGEDMADCGYADDSRMLEQVMQVLDGRYGEYRNPNPHLALIQATHDQDAIASWPAYSRVNSPSTIRAYRKEIERFQGWAYIERAKPLSGLNEDDLLAYEAFLKYPVSRHREMVWVSGQPLDASTGKPCANQRAIRKRGSPYWRPFIGPLSPTSVDYALGVLKSLYAYWTGVGYTVLHPRRLPRKSVRRDRTTVAKRVLSPGTWEYLYSYLDQRHNQIPDEPAARRRLSLLRQANQRHMIFAALYLLGVRLSELAAIRMSDFRLRYSSGGEAQYWVRIGGKGTKERTIPVPSVLMAVLADYRRRINAFPVVRRGVFREQHGAVVPLSILPTPKDDSAMILSCSGTSPLGPTRLSRIVKDTLAEALNEYHRLAANGQAPAQVNVDQLANASTHWLRHTSATRLVKSDTISLSYIQKFLGHASCDTTGLYVERQIDNNQWALEMRKFHCS